MVCKLVILIHVLGLEASPWWAFCYGADGAELDAEVLFPYSPCPTELTINTTSSPSQNWHPPPLFPYNSLLAA